MNIFQSIVHEVVLSRGGYWHEDAIFNRLIEELGEFARSRRDLSQAVNNPDNIKNERDELHDCLFTLLAYANSKGYDMLNVLVEKSKSKS